MRGHSSCSGESIESRCRSVIFGARLSEAESLLDFRIEYWSTLLHVRRAPLLYPPPDPVGRLLVVLRQGGPAGRATVGQAVPVIYGRRRGVSGVWQRVVEGGARVLLYVRRLGSLGQGGVHLVHHLVAVLVVAAVVRVGWLVVLLLLLRLLLRWLVGVNLLVVVSRSWGLLFNHRLLTSELVVVVRLKMKLHSESVMFSLRRLVVGLSWRWRLCVCH